MVEALSELVDAHQAGKLIPLKCFDDSLSLFGVIFVRTLAEVEASFLEALTEDAAIVSIRRKY